MSDLSDLTPPPSPRAGVGRVHDWANDVSNFSSLSLNRSNTVPYVRGPDGVASDDDGSDYAKPIRKSRKGKRSKKPSRDVPAFSSSPPRSPPPHADDVPSLTEGTLATGEVKRIQSPAPQRSQRQPRPTVSLTVPSSEFYAQNSRNVVDGAVRHHVETGLPVRVVQRGEYHHSAQPNTKVVERFIRTPLARPHIDRPERLPVVRKVASAARYEYVRTRRSKAAPPAVESSGGSFFNLLRRGSSGSTVASDVRLLSWLSGSGGTDVVRGKSPERCSSRRDSMLRSGYGGGTKENKRDRRR
jgi:hypothetical protein